MPAARRSLWRVCAPAAAALIAGLLAAPHRLPAQLVFENPQQKWRAGESVELLLQGGERGRKVDVDSVLFDGQAVRFDVLGPGARPGEVRLRILIPATIKPGTHAIAVRFAGAARATVPRVPPPVSRFAVEILAQTQVPAIAGLDLAAAAQRIAESGLRLDLGSEQDIAPPGSVVLAQDPAAGTTVAVGSRVAATLGVVVPELAGRGIDLAKPLILERGLLPKIVLREPAAGPFETVLAQEPPAGRLVAPGTPVQVVIESRPVPPPPRRWPWALLLAALAAGASYRSYRRQRTRRWLRKNFRAEVHHDLDGLRAATTAPAWEGRELRLDLRLLGRPDPGLQTLTFHGALASKEAAR